MNFLKSGIYTIIAIAGLSTIAAHAFPVSHATGECYLIQNGKAIHHSKKCKITSWSHMSEYNVSFKAKGGGSIVSLLFMV